MSENVLSPDRSAEEPLAGEVAVDPATGRPAGRAAGAGPAAVQLPGRARRRAAGAGAAATSRTRSPAPPGVKALTPIVLTAPALVIGLTAMFAGRIVDRLGRKRLLVGALVVYAVRRHRPAVAAVAAADRRQPGAGRADRGRDHDLLHDAAGRLLPRLAAGALLRPAGGLHHRRGHHLLRRRRRAGRAELADAVLALRRQPAAGRRRRPLRLAAGPAGAGRRAHREAAAAAVAHAGARRSASRCSAGWSSTC